MFEELDYRPTPMGALSLRRRRLPAIAEPVYEVKLGDEFLMSSLFTAAETEMAGLALARLPGQGLDVVVGGLGLGYTARAALDHASVGSLLVVDALPEVIEWHREGLLPLGPGLAADPRCRLVQGDFFAMAGGDGFDPDMPDRRFDAVLLDVDHAPDRLLHGSHAAFYTPAGLARLAARLRPGGVFALWSDDPPDAAFMALLQGAFASASAHEVAFTHPLGGQRFTNTVYLAGTAPGA